MVRNVLLSRQRLISIVTLVTIVTFGSAAAGLDLTSPLGYRSARVAALLDAAATAPDPGRLTAVYRELGDVTRDDMPFTFLYPQVHTFVAHRRIAGLSTPHRADVVRYLEFLRIDEGER